MKLMFYFFSLLTVVFTILSVFQNNIVYSLFYLSASIISTSAIFFLLGSYFIGVLQIIIYAGAIMVLFIFSVMMFDLNEKIKRNKKNRLLMWLYPIVLFILFLLLIFRKLLYFRDKYIIRSEINLHVLGINLFGPYILIVEFASLLLLSALIMVLIIANNQQLKNIFVNKNKD